MAKRRAKKKQPPKETPKPQQREITLNPDIEVEEQVPLNELPTIFPNSYEAVVAAARRARQLNLGLRPLVKTKMQRPVDVALAELAAKKVEYAVDDEIIQRLDAPAKPKKRTKTS
ncbi:MAG: DNA-directed RNA polymerase subunit omega [bacterium]